MTKEQFFDYLCEGFAYDETDNRAIVFRYLYTELITSDLRDFYAIIFILHDTFMSLTKNTRNLHEKHRYSEMLSAIIEIEKHINDFSGKEIFK